ncbi:MAG: hypothetical protein J1G04_06535 [Clostridiales bacterium]|nr:hypothetical protein [Clostridiales bacterium]
MKTSGFGEFVSACEEIKNSKFVLAPSKITALLKSIADNKQLYSMFAAALVDFDYKRVFTSCVNGASFVLPQEPKTVIALVFRILMDIDAGIMPLQNFLEAYFYSNSVNESYSRFVLEIIAPFETYCRMYFVRATELPEDFLNDGDKMTQAYNEMGDKLRDELKTDALSCVSALINIADGAINGMIDKAEYIACLNGLSRSIKSRNYDDIISSFLGVKYAVAYFFKTDKAVVDIYRKLEYDIKRLAS